MEKDRTWYIALLNISGFHEVFVGAGSKDYIKYKEIAARRGIRVIAEQFGVTDRQIERLSYDSSGVPSSSNPLTNLRARLNAGEQFDVQKELEIVCSAV